MTARTAFMKLLLVDDDDDVRSSIARRLTRHGHTVSDTSRPLEAIEFAKQQQFDVALVDLSMQEMNGIELLIKLKQIDPACSVVMLTGAATVETAVQAMKEGAYDYVRKPCPLDELLLILTRAWERRQLGQQNFQLRSALARFTPASEIIGESREIQEVQQLISRAAPTDRPVLILGESGTGKELVARAIHRQSDRSEQPLVTVNCAALQESLLESELFGHEKGAFTGAVAAKPGLFEVADNGTLFVDEFGELAPPLQAKLLRVLEDGSFRRVGSTRECKVDVRIIAATNKDLAEEVRAGRFREDLYYRINVLALRLPPLRERRDDIGRLVDHFLRSTFDGRLQMADDAQAAMCSYDWPGNIRELRNVLERAAILSDDGRIHPEHLPDDIAGDKAASRLVLQNNTDNLEERERLHVARVLEREQWNRNKTAAALGISRRSLYRLIEKYGIEKPDEGRMESE